MSQVADSLALGRVGRPTRPWWTLPNRWRNPIGIVGAAIVLLTIVVALAAPVIAPYDPDSQESVRLLPPSLDNPMVSDDW